MSDRATTLDGPDLTKGVLLSTITDGAMLLESPRLTPRVGLCGSLAAHATNTTRCCWSPAPNRVAL